MRAVLLVVSLLVLSGCSAPPGTGDWPTSIAVLGHSGATGFNSDPSLPNRDARDNSWATGTNPDVDSVYLRAVESSPSLEGHAFNAAVSGSNVDDLPAQVASALKQEPVPDLFIVQSVDNDIQCDGTDDQNVVEYRQKIQDVLQSIADGAPGAQIYAIGQWSTVQKFTDVVADRPDIVAANQGGGICDVFDASGAESLEAIARLQAIVDSYQAALRDACAEVIGCLFDGDAVLAMEITADDLTSDTNHLSVAGQHKLAELAWSRLDQIREG